MYKKKYKNVNTESLSRVTIVITNAHRWSSRKSEKITIVYGSFVRIRFRIMFKSFTVSIFSLN